MHPAVESVATQSARRWWVLPVLVAVAFTLLQGVAGPRQPMNGDSQQYARLALRIYGDSPAQAARSAWNAGCESTAAEAQRISSLDPIRFRQHSTEVSTVRGCERTDPLVNPTVRTRRYEKIFDGRIGYPLLAGPAVQAFGVRYGLWATAVTSTALAGFLAAALLTAAGVGLWGAVAGEVLFLICPLGQWGVHPLAEGTLNAAVLLTLLGAWWLLQRRLWRGSAVWALGLAATTLVKYSSGTLLAIVLVLAAAGCALTVRPARHAGTAVLGAGSLLTAGLITGLTSALGEPGSVETLQDTFTRHFHRRDVPNPWGMLAHLDARFWLDFLRGQAAGPALLLLSGLGLWLLFRRRGGIPALGWLAAAGAGLGVLTVTAHPLIYEYDRLGVLEWLPAVLGLPLLLRRGAWDLIRSGEVEPPALTSAPEGTSEDTEHAQRSVR